MASASVLLVVLGLSAGTASAAGRVEKAANALSELLSNGGANTVKTSETDPVEMAKHYYIDQNDDADVQIVKDVTSFNSETNEIGFFKSADVAVAATIAEVSYCVENDMVDPEGEDPEANAKFTAETTKLIKSLKMPGVVFAYDASGQGWGGMPISILLVIDTKMHKVHAVTMQCNAYHD